MGMREASFEAKSMPCECLIGRVSNGIAVRLVGRGTMFESHAFRAAIDLQPEPGVILFDATQCDYLDSTFLGCLVGLKKTCDHTPNGRFVIAAPPPIRARLFSSSSLDRYFDFVD